MTTTTKSQGAVLTWGGTTLGEITSYSMPGADTPEIDIGSFADTVVKTRPGNPMGGAITFGVNFNPDDTSQSGVEADILTGVERSFAITFPEGTLDTVTCTGRAMDFSINAAKNDIWKGEIMIKVTGIESES